MKYFIDTEFLEGTQTDRGLFGWPQQRWNMIWATVCTLLTLRFGYIALFNFSYFQLCLFLFFAVWTGVLWINQSNNWQNEPTIDLISIGIVSEDGREFYAISKDFNLREAWNRYDLNYGHGDVERNAPPKKVYWIRENVLLPIFNELYDKYIDTGPYRDINAISYDFNYRDLRKLINKYGKSNKEISNLVYEFCKSKTRPEADNPAFYGYYCDYDWVVFCWLFGRMIDLPKGFPMYCRDLKQMLDEKAENFKDISALTLDQKLMLLKADERFPKQGIEHSAIHDARWNLKLYKFIQAL